MIYTPVSSPGTLPKFLADYSSNRVLERLPPVLHALAQGAVMRVW